MPGANHTLSNGKRVINLDSHTLLLAGVRGGLAGGGPVAPVVAPAEGKEGKDDDTDDAGGKEGGGKPRDEHGGGSFNIDVNAPCLCPRKHGEAMGYDGE